MKAALFSRLTRLDSGFGGGPALGRVVGQGRHEASPAACRAKSERVVIKWGRTAGFFLLPWGGAPLASEDRAGAPPAE